MTDETQIQLRFVCIGCDEPCYCHTEGHKFIGFPHNCLYSGGTGDWHAQTIVDGEWALCSDEMILSLFYVDENDPAKE